MFASGVFGKVAELGERVGVVGELRENAAGQRDVARLDLDACRGGKRLD